MQENLHVLEIERERVRLEKIVADHAGEVKAKRFFPRERSIVETANVFFLDISKGKVMHSVRDDFQDPAATFTPAPINPVSTNKSEGGSASTRPQPTMKWSLAIHIGTATLLPDDVSISCLRFLAVFRRSTSSPLG